jgi:hypothetical protein
MNKLIIASLFAAMFWFGNPAAPCGWDFQQAHDEGLPPTYCFARQARGDILFDGLLKKACSGTSCPITNNLSGYIYSK